MTLIASNSMIGSTSALFDSISVGAKDFLGSADFIVSIERGSSSLHTGTVGCLVGSVGEIPSAVVHDPDTAVGDREYFSEGESIRGGRARAVASPAQALFNGAFSFGHEIASGAAGLIYRSVRGTVEDDASGFMKGLRKGVIGGALKLITDGQDLIAAGLVTSRRVLIMSFSGQMT